MSDESSCAPADRDLRVFEHQLRLALARAELGDGTGKPVESILNLACGQCDEAQSLRRAAAASVHDHLPRLCGVDIRDREIGRARERFGSRDVEFIVGDGRQLDHHRELEDEFDLVFFRHQNWWNGDVTWKEIFDRGIARVSAGGKLVITSYFEREHALAVEAIRSLGAELLVDHQNPLARSLACPGKSVDRHIAVFKVD